MSDIPARHPFVPRIPGPGEKPPDGSLYPRGSADIDNSGAIFEEYIDIRRYQYWRLIHTHTLDCGMTHTQTVTVTVGLSESITAELASKIGASADGISAELSSKLSRTITITAQHSDSHQVSYTAPRCEGATVTAWQLIDRYEITVTSEGLFGVVSNSTSVFEVPQEVFADDVLTFPKEECCPQTSMHFDREGYRQAFVLDFGTAARLTLGKYTETGAIAFAGVEGTYHRHDLVPLTAMPKDFASSIRLYRDQKSLTRAFIEPIGVESLLSGDKVATAKAKLLLEKVNELPREKLAATMGAGLAELTGRLLSRREARGHFRSANELAETVGAERFYEVVDRVLAPGKAIGEERELEGAFREGDGVHRIRVQPIVGLNVERLTTLLREGIAATASDVRPFAAGDVDARTELAEAMVALLLKGLEASAGTTSSPTPSEPTSTSSSTPAAGDPIDID